MNILGLPNEITMSSIDIAHELNKRHDHIMRDIRNQLDQQGLGHPIYGGTYTTKQNKVLDCFSLDYDQTMILISGYSIPLRAKIIKRWTDLEKNNRPEPPTQLQLAEQVVELLKEREANKDKIEFFDTVTKLDSWLTFKEVANMLNIPNLGRNNLTKRLRELKYINQFNKPYQRYIDQKLFKVIETVKSGKIYTSTVVSQKGLDRLIKVLNE